MPFSRNPVQLIAVFLIAASVGSNANAQGRNFVELEIVGDRGTILNSGQKWLEKLSDVGADSVSMNQADDASPDVKKTKTASGASYKITGVINHRNQLILPGGRYSLRDTAKIKAYVDSIRADGAEVALADKLAFGLTAEQLVAVHKEMMPAYTSETTGETPVQVLAKIRRNCRTKFVLDESAKTALKSDYMIEDELNGLAQGTVLAAVLRPLGLVAAPRREQGKATEILITDSQQVEEHWPIGWPMQTRPSQSIPKLYDRIPVNIKNYKLDATLGAIQKSLELPFVYDYNSMARTGIDLTEIRVTLEAERMSYLLVLQKIIAQAKPRMQLDYRVDENGKPFVWLSSR